MRLEILHVPDCPNLSALEQRLGEALTASRQGAALSRRVIDTAKAAAAAGMTGSPTLLVDGIDPFAEPGTSPSLSCRLYRGADGRVDGAPSVAALRRALGSAGQRCGTDEARGSAAALSTWRSRAAPADPAERAVHQAILQAFATAGSPPVPAELDRTTAPFETSTDQLLSRLHAADIIRLGPDGQIRVAYPFSAAPTRHRVRLAGRAEVYAMCMIDALGMPAMLGADAVISTSDPASQQPITVTITGGQVMWEPATGVVFVGAQPGGGPSAISCCDYLNAFTDRPAAQAWADAHPHINGEILDNTTAERLGQRIFGGLLTRS